jgi:hypothetical protein
MSRTLTRPMFRKGGMAQREKYMGGGIKTIRPKYMGGGMTGIMSGIRPDAGLTPRVGYKEGTYQPKDYESIVAAENIGNIYTPKYLDQQFRKDFALDTDVTSDPGQFQFQYMTPDRFLPKEDILKRADILENPEAYDFFKKEYIKDKYGDKIKKQTEILKKAGDDRLANIYGSEKLKTDTPGKGDSGMFLKPKKKETVTQQLDDTPSDQDTIKSYMDMFQAALGTDEDDITRDKYLQLAKFGANLLAQPGGDLVGAIGKAAAPSIEGLAKTQAAAKAADREVKLAAIKTAIDKMDDPTLDKIKSLSKAANLPIEEVAKSFVETAQEGKTKESIITTNQEAMEGEIGKGPALKAARTMAEAGLNFALFDKLPVDKNGEIKPDTPNGYYYDEKGNLSIVKDGVKSDIKFKAKE